MRRVRHLRPSGRRGSYSTRPARAAAPRPGGRWHRLLRRRALPDGTPPGPGGRPLLLREGDQPPAGFIRTWPRALFDHRRNHPAQRAAAVRGTRRRWLRRRPQWQPDQWPDAAPRTDRPGRHLPVDIRHGSDPASRGALAEDAHGRTLHRRTACPRRRLCAGGADQQEADRRARSQRHPPADPRRVERRPYPVLGNLRARHHRRQVHPRSRERRSCGHLGRRDRKPQALPQAAVPPLHLRIHLFLPARLHAGWPLHL